MISLTIKMSSSPLEIAANYEMDPTLMKCGLDGQ